MLFGGRISWSHGKESCCPGSFILYSSYDSQNCIVPSQRGKIGLSCKSLVLFQAFVAFLKLLERILLSAERGGGIAPDRLAPVILSLSCVLQLLLTSRHQAVPTLSSQGFCCSCAVVAPNSAALSDLNRDLHRYESTQNLAHSLVCMQKYPCSFKLINKCFSTNLSGALSWYQLNKIIVCTLFHLMIFCEQRCPQIQFSQSLVSAYGSAAVILRNISKPWKVQQQHRECAVIVRNLF